MKEEEDAQVQTKRLSKTQSYEELISAEVERCVRIIEQQNKYFDVGCSKLMQSRHFARNRME